MFYLISVFIVLITFILSLILFYIHKTFKIINEKNFITENQNITFQTNESILYEDGTGYIQGIINRV